MDELQTYRRRIVMQPFAVNPNAARLMEQAVANKWRMMRRKETAKEVQARVERPRQTPTALTQAAIEFIRQRGEATAGDVVTALWHMLDVGTDDTSKRWHDLTPERRKALFPLKRRAGEDLMKSIKWRHPGALRSRKLRELNVWSVIDRPGGTA